MYVPYRDGLKNWVARIAFRGQFDLVTARAVAPLNTLVEYLLPLVRMSGLAVIFKGGSAPQEFIEARKAIETLGGETVRLAPVQRALPGRIPVYPVDQKSPAYTGPLPPRTGSCSQAAAIDFRRIGLW